MDFGILKNLELLPKILKLLLQMLERMDKFAPPLTSKKEVARFLNVTTRTINNYIEKGYLVENKHFYRKSDRIMVFIEDAIFEFRDELQKGVTHEKATI